MRYTHPDVLDEALDYIKQNCNKMVLIDLPGSTTPTYAQVMGAYHLADVDMTASDFTIGNGVESGRQVIVAEKNGVDVDTSGDGNHMALVDTSTSRILHITETNVAAVSSPGSFNASNWRVEIQDPISFS